MTSTRAAAALLVTFTIARGVGLAAAYPALHGPDEWAHLDYVQCLVEGRAGEGGHSSPEMSALNAAYVEPAMADPGTPVPPLGSIELPDPSSPGARRSSSCYVANLYSPLYYWTVTPAYLAVGREAPLPHRIFGARLVSVAWGCVGVLAAFAAGTWLFGTAAGGLLLGLSVAAQPQAWFMTSVVNNDAALLACSFAALAAAAAMRRYRGSPYPPVAFAIAAVLGVFAKPTLLFYAPALYACALAGLAGEQRCHRRAAAVTLPAVVVGIGWLMLHPPAPFAGPPQITLAAFLREWVWNADRAWWLWVKTYWMAWGWLDTLLPERYYSMITLMLAGAAVGLAVGWRTLQRDGRGVAVLAAVVSAYCVATLYALEYFMMIRNSSLVFIQGRYLLPFLPLVLATMIYGWGALGGRLRARLDLRWIVPLVLLGVDLAAVIRMAHRYHG